MVVFQLYGHFNGSFGSIIAFSCRYHFDHCFFFGVSLNLFLSLRFCMYINVKECQQSNDRAIKTRRTQCKSPGGIRGLVKTYKHFWLKLLNKKMVGPLCELNTDTMGFDDDGDIHIMDKYFGLKIEEFK